MPEINVGDVVRLKSGGPLMTVRSINDNDAFCDWFDPKEDAKNQVFQTWQLERQR